MKSNLSSICCLILICGQILWTQCKTVEDKDNTKFPDNIPGPFEKGVLNLILYILIATIGLLILLLICCLCCCICCRKAEDESLAVTPSELIAIGATPSDLKAANISPSVLKDSGATYDQMAKLGATPSQLVEAGAEKEDLVRLGATKSQLSHVGLKDSKVKTPQKEDQISNYLSKRPASPKTIEKKKDLTTGSTKMSKLAQSMAEKLKSNSKQNSKQSKRKQSKEEDIKVSSIATPKDTTVEPSMAPMSTVSTSPQKKAAALKATDDSMSVAMGPSDKN